MIFLQAEENGGKGTSLPLTISDLLVDSCPL